MEKIPKWKENRRYVESFSFEKFIFKGKQQQIDKRFFKNHKKNLERILQNIEKSLENPQKLRMFFRIFRKNP